MRKKFVIMFIVLVVLWIGSFVIFKCVNHKSNNEEKNTKVETIKKEQVSTTEKEDTDVDSTVENENIRTQEDKKINSETTNKNQETTTKNNQTQTKKQEQVVEQQTTTQEPATKTAWEELGMTYKQYMNQPSMSWMRVDFKTFDECTNYGNSYEPYLYGEE